VALLSCDKAALPNESNPTKHHIHILFINIPHLLRINNPGHSITGNSK